MKQCVFYAVRFFPAFSDIHSFNRVLERNLPSGNVPFADFPRFLVSKGVGMILLASLSNCEIYHSNTSQKNGGHVFEFRSKFK